MEEFFHRANRNKIKSLFMRLDNATGTELTKRYTEWLSIMDAAQVSYRKDIPAGINDCVSYLVKKSDIEEWIETEDLYAPRPYRQLCRTNEDLADYDCGIAYYFKYRIEVKSRIRKIQEHLDTDPGDRYAGTKNPYEDIHIPFSPELQTARMVIDAKLPVTLDKLRHKMNVYDRIITCVAIQTLGLESAPVLDEFLFDQLKGKDLSQVKRIIEGALKKLEHEQCTRRGIEWKESP